MDDKTLEVIKSEAGKLLLPVAEAEMQKMKKVVEQSVHKIEAYAKKNPEKTTLVSAAVGAAVGAALAILLQSDTSSKSSKKK